MKLTEIADGILKHLERFAAQKPLNTPHTQYWTPHAWAAGSRVGVRYVSYQGNHFMTKADAEAYLEWLNAGNIGKFWKFEDLRKKAQISGEKEAETCQN